jgi:hypothetical protein
MYFDIGFHNYVVGGKDCDEKGTAHGFWVAVRCTTTAQKCNFNLVFQRSCDTFRGGLWANPIFLMSTEGFRDFPHEKHKPTKMLGK